MRLKILTCMLPPPSDISHNHPLDFLKSHNLLVGSGAVEGAISNRGWFRTRHPTEESHRPSLWWRGLRAGGRFK